MASAMAGTDCRHACPLLARRAPSLKSSAQRKQGIRSPCPTGPAPAEKHQKHDTGCHWLPFRSECADADPIGHAPRNRGKRHGHHSVRIYIWQGHRELLGCATGQVGGCPCCASFPSSAPLGNEIRGSRRYFSKKTFQISSVVSS